MIDQICDVFEQHWKGGSPPRIEDFLSAAEVPRNELLRELLWIELSYRKRAGQTPDIADYIHRWPEHAEMFEDLFASFQHEATSVTWEETPVPTAPDVRCSLHLTRLRFIAEGGLGQVFEAKDQQLKRRVAVKFIHPNFAEDGEADSRFRLEAEITSRLDHPGVVPVHAIGHDSHGRAFYVMRYIDGTSFREAIARYHDFCRQGRPASARMMLRDLLMHLVSACKTVAYAHNRGVLHRDLKPENLMLGRYGETLVVDWGLVSFIERDDVAKASGEKTLLPESMIGSDTSSHGAAGTIGYISPEQTPGAALPVTPAADVYSLGATLYHLLTGAAPFHRQQGISVWERIRAGDFPRPRWIQSSCPPDLEAICLKAMATRPQDRYASALELADDLERWLADEPVSVRRQSFLERVTRVGHRHRTATAVSGAALLLLMFTAFVLAAVLGDKARTESILRHKMEAARLTNLEMAAAFAAEGFGQEIDRRWDALSEAMSETDEDGRTLHDLVLAAKDAAPRSQEMLAVRDWIDRHGSPWVAHNAAESWFVCDAAGVQIARHPWAASMGEPFHYRSYFQAAGYDLPASVEPHEVIMIVEPTVSSPYVGTVQLQLTVVFSLPIRKTLEDEPIGVLGMAVELGKQLNAFSYGSHDADTILVDLRPDSLAGLRDLQSGVVIKHPRLKPGREPYRIDRLLVQRLNEAPSFLDPMFVDPVDETGQPRPAALFKILIRPRDALGRTIEFAPHVETGWAVIVQDRAGVVP